MTSKNSHYCFDDTGSKTSNELIPESLTKFEENISSGENSVHKLEQCFPNFLLAFLLAYFDHQPKIIQSH